MIEAFIGLLQRVGVQADDCELAEMLWLARHLPRPEPAPIRQKDESAALIKPPKLAIKKTDEPDQIAIDEKRAQAIQAKEETEKDLFPKPFRKYEEMERQASRAASLVRVPTVPALPGSLEIGRALRPLMRRYRSNSYRVFDEEATAHEMAKAKMARIETAAPQLHPDLERWFELALVVEEDRSFAIWRETLAELHRLLANHGAFRDVRRWSLRVSNGRVVLSGPSGVTRNPLELIDPVARRLIMVVSDCISDGWRRGEIPALLAEWGRRASVVLVHLLPERRWGSTAVGEATSWLQAELPGLANRDLTVELPWWDEASLGTRVAMPVMPLEAGAIQRWARMLMAMGEAAAPGVLLASRAGIGAEGRGYEEQKPAAEKLIERFRSTVSPTAFQLAAYLAAAPLTLPVMRLVQQAMLPDSHPSHLAEVLLGGLMKCVTPEDTRLPDEEITYEFHEGVRERLLSSILKTEAIQVLRTVASVVEHQIGRPIDFPALFPDTDGQYRLPEGVIPFAKVGAQVLERLGIKPPRTTGKEEQVEVSTTIPVDLTNIHYKVFLSSTARDLANYREAVFRDISRMDEFHCVRMEDFGARDSMANDFCRQKVAECDVVVLIIGLCYGGSPAGSEDSYTLQEYRAAVDTRRSRLTFMSPDNHFYPGYYRETDDLWQRQQAFHKQVAQERILDRFTTPDELAGKVVSALSNWARERNMSSATQEPVTMVNENLVAESERHYLRTLIKQCDPLDLTPIDEAYPQVGKSGEASSVSVSEVFTTLYLARLTRSPRQKIATIIRKQGEHSPHQKTGAEEERLPIQAVEAVAAVPRLVILGQPGGGKSTLVNYIATQLARRRLKELVAKGTLLGWREEEKPLPVHIILRRFAAWTPLISRMELPAWYGTI